MSLRTILRAPFRHLARPFISAIHERINLLDQEFVLVRRRLEQLSGEIASLETNLQTNLQAPVDSQLLDRSEVHALQLAELRQDTDNLAKSNRALLQGSIKTIELLQEFRAEVKQFRAEVAPLQKIPEKLVEQNNCVEGFQARIDGLARLTEGVIEKIAQESAIRGEFDAKLQGVESQVLSVISHLQSHRTIFQNRTQQLLNQISLLRLRAKRQELDLKRLPMRRSSELRPRRFLRVSDLATQSAVTPSKEEEWGAHERRVFTRLRDAGFLPRVIYDIGAADGNWAELLDSIYPDAIYHLFEPQAEQRNSFKVNLASCVWKHPNFTVHPFALGAETQILEMRSKGDGYSSSTLVFENSEYDERLNVQQFRLDDYVSAKQLPFPDVIKMDVQGAEAMVLEGGRECLKHASVVFAETWLERGYGPQTPLITELREILLAQGFELVEIGAHAFKGPHVLYGFDAYFIRRDQLETLAPLMPSREW